MLALPSEPGTIGLVLLGVGAVTGLIAGIAVARVLASHARIGVAAAVGTMIAAAVASAPFTSWRLVQDIRYTARIDGSTAERIGAYENYLDATIFDELLARIPSSDRYYVRVSDTVRPESAAYAFHVWGLTWLLPRRAVTDPEDADWLVTWGVDPYDVGVELSRVWRIRRPAYGFPATFLAEVAS